MATSTVQTVGDIPKALEPFYTTPDTGLIPRATTEIFQPFEERYAPLIQAGLVGAGTVAPMSEYQKLVGTRLENMGLPSAFTDAETAGGEALAGYRGIQDISAPELEQYQLGPTRQFTAAEMQTYMDPYMQGVVDIQQRKAREAAQQAQLGTNLGSARQGSYGGARQALLQGQRESGLRTQLGDIQATGLQAAFQQAQQQFERDRAAEMAADRANLEAKLGVQQLGAGQTMEAARANQAAALQGAAGLTNLAQTMGGLGTQQLAGELDITKTMGAYGDLERELEQQKLDADRQYLESQAGYGMQQISDYANLLRGVPLSDTTQRTTTPAPSFASQLTGLGITGIGLYNLLGGR